jgi:hypothetical protein
MVIRADEEFVRLCARSSAALAELTKSVVASQGMLQTRKGTLTPCARVCWVAPAVHGPANSCYPVPSSFMVGGDHRRGVRAVSHRHVLQQPRDS